MTEEAPGDRGGIVRCRVIATGRVQGVWFRESCRREATAAGVAGWVRNRDDGAVEAVLEGDTKAVERVLTWMRIGPTHAIVTKVDVREEPPLGESAFRVR